MEKSFYEYIYRFVDAESRNPVSRLANQIYSDGSFPKAANEFAEIADYLEHNPEYSQLLLAFDDVWHKYEFES